MLLYGGSLKRLFRLVNERRVRLAFSPATIDELIRVIQYPKIREAAEKLAVPIEALTDKLIAASLVVQPSTRVAVVREDPADNRILEAALESCAMCIVSGDKHLLKLKRFQGIPIVSPRVFLQRFAAGFS